MLWLFLPRVLTLKKIFRAGKNLQDRLCDARIRDPPPGEEPVSFNVHLVQLNLHFEWRNIIY